MTNSEMTEERRRLILWVLWIHGRGTPKSINRLLATHIEQKAITWPQAPWKDAKNEPYYTGTYQHLCAMRREGEARVRQLKDGMWDWNPETLTVRAHAQDVLTLRRNGHGNKQIATQLGLSEGLVSALYHDPFGFRERERKAKYCGGCGEPKDAGQDVCLGCARRRREKRANEVEDRIESLLPDEVWARSLPVLLPVDFAVTDELQRVLIVHTARGKIEHKLARGESWEHAVAELGVLRHA